MAIFVYGRRLSEDAEKVRYLVGRDENDPEPHVVVIAADDPSDWHLEDEGGNSNLASRVVRSAREQRERTGTWPEWASYIA